MARQRVPRCTVMATAGCARPGAQALGPPRRRRAAAAARRRGATQVLMQHRAPWTANGDTWGLPGGARDSHESARRPHCGGRRGGRRGARVRPGARRAARLPRRLALHHRRRRGPGCASPSWATRRAGTCAGWPRRRSSCWTCTPASPAPGPCSGSSTGPERGAAGQMRRAAARPARGARPSGTPAQPRAAPPWCAACRCGRGRPAARPAPGSRRSGSPRTPARSRPCRAARPAPAPGWQRDRVVPVALRGWPPRRAASARSARAATRRRAPRSRPSSSASTIVADRHELAVGEHVAVDERGLRRLRSGGPGRREIAWLSSRPSGRSSAYRCGRVAGQRVGADVLGHADARDRVVRAVVDVAVVLHADLDEVRRRRPRRPASRA